MFKLCLVPTKAFPGIPLNVNKVFSLRPSYDPLFTFGLFLSNSNCAGASFLIKTSFHLSGFSGSVECLPEELESDSSSNSIDLFRLKFANSLLNLIVYFA